MKKILVTAAVALVMGLFGQDLHADPSSPVVVRHSRTNSTVGASMTKGYDSPWSFEGVGALSRTFTFFDADSSTGGLYWGFGASLAGSAGGIAIADTWLATLGWMGNPLTLVGSPPFDFDVNLSVSPTLGSRIKDRTIQGVGYLGVGFSVGASVPLPFSLPLVGNGALGLSWDPVVPVTRVLESREVPNTGYMNLALTWTMKLNTETRTLPWKG